MTLVGVGHVFDIASQVEGIITTVEPDVVALELDRHRLQALLSPGKGRGGLPFFHSVLASLQERIAKKYGVATGSEMAAAARTARGHAIGILCIDRDVRIVMDRLWHGIPLRKKLLFMASAVTSLFLSKKRVDKEISSFESEPQRYLQDMRSTLPELYAILIEERNRHMAARVREALQMYDCIVAFIGEGHMPGMEELLADDVALSVIHLSDLRTHRWREQLPEAAPP